MRKKSQSSSPPLSHTLLLPVADTFIVGIAKNESLIQQFLTELGCTLLREYLEATFGLDSEDDEMIAKEQPSIAWSVGHTDKKKLEVVVGSNAYASSLPSSSFPPPLLTLTANNISPHPTATTTSTTAPSSSNYLAAVQRSPSKEPAGHASERVATTSTSCSTSSSSSSRSISVHTHTGRPQSAANQAFLICLLKYSILHIRVLSSLFVVQVNL